MFDSLTLAEEFIGGLLDTSLGNLIVKVETFNRVVLSWSSGAREREHKSFGNTVEFSVRLESNRLPFFATVNPVAHVIDGSVSSGGSGREFAEFNDFSTTLLDTGGEFIVGP